MIRIMGCSQCIDVVRLHNEDILMNLRGRDRPAINTIEFMPVHSPETNRLSVEQNYALLASPAAVFPAVALSIPLRRHFLIQARVYTEQEFRRSTAADSLLHRK